MKVLLINSPNRLSREPEFFPYGIGLLAAVGKNFGHDVVVYDCNLYRDINRLENYLRSDRSWDIVGISGLITTYSFQIEVSELIKKRIPHVLLLSGGGLASSVPELLLTNSEIDVACIGEGESVFGELLNVFSTGSSFTNVLGIVWKDKGGNLHHNPPAGEIQNLDTLPFPDWDAVGLTKYFPYSGFSHKGENATSLRKRADITTTRGCPYHCSFCSNVFSRKKIRARSIGNVISEIQLLIEKYQIEAVDFLDENFCYSKNRVIEFCEKILSSGIRISWGTAARVDDVDREMLELMKKSGCAFLLFGFESGSQIILDGMNKKITVEQAWKTFVEAEEVGIHAHGNLIIGHPGESLDSLRESLLFQTKRMDYYKMKNQNRLNDLSFKQHLSRYFGTVSFCTPYPGSSIYEKHIEILGDLDSLMRKLTFRDARELTVNLTDLSIAELLGAQSVLSNPDLWIHQNLI